MFQRAKTFVRNHWKKAVIGGIAIQVASYGLRYASNRFLSYQSDQAQLYWKKIKKQQHFSNLEDNCLQTFRQLFQLMKLTIGSTLNAEELQEQLRSQNIDNQTKLKMWEDLKLIAFTRVITTIYGSSILLVLLRIQLSIIGGTIYSQEDHSNTQLQTEETQRNYLNLANTFASKGVSKICHYIYKKAISVVGPFPLKQNMSCSDIEEIMWAIIRQDVEMEDGGNLYGNPCLFSWRYAFTQELLRNDEFYNRNELVIVEHEGEDDKYRELITETFDLLESDDTKDILRFFESTGISHYVDRIADFIRVSGSGIGGSDLSSDNTAGLEEARVPLAKLIPAMTSLHLIDVVDDPWVYLLTNCESVSIFAANIYEAFSS